MSVASPQHLNSEQPTTFPVKVTSPREAPVDYGIKRLVSQLVDIRAITSNEYASMLGVTSTSSLLERISAMLDRFKREPPYKVLDSGEGEIMVPFLSVSAPSVPDVSVKGSLSSTEAASGGFEVKVFGNGVSADATVTVTHGYELAVEPGHRQVASFILPVIWEKRSWADNDDYSWTQVEPVHDTNQVRVDVSLSHKVDVLPADSPLTISTINADKAIFNTDESYTLQSNYGYSVGFKNAAAGIEATLTAKVEQTTKLDLSIGLPKGHVYRIYWLQGPGGADVRIE